MRILIDISEESVRELDRLAKMYGASRASLIRKAVDDHIRHTGSAVIAEAFALWSVKGEDGLAYQERVRSEW